MLLIVLLAGLAVFLLAIGFYAWSQREEQAVADRLQQYNTSRRAAHSPDFWAEFSHSPIGGWTQKGASRFGSFLPQRDWFDLQVQRAGLPVTGGEFIILSLGSAIVVAVAVFALALSPLYALAAAALWLAIAVFYIKRKANKRMAAFEQQLGDVLAMLSNAIKAGFSFPQAMDVVVQEFSDPISTEFARALKEAQLGLPIETALEGIERRIVNDDFALVVTAVVVQRQVGGNLAQILDTIGNTVRDRLKFKGEVKTLTAEGVMSAWIIGLMPFFLAAVFLLMNPNYFDGLIKHDIGRLLIGGGLISELIGAFIIYRIVNVKF